MTLTDGMLFKYLDTEGWSRNRGVAKWNLPKNNKPGKWMPRIKNIEPCKRGYHLCRKADLVRWYGETLWIAEGRGGAIVHKDSKIVFEQARLVAPVPQWNTKTILLLAADFAEHTLPYWKNFFPYDRWPKDLINAIRLFARGEITKEELKNIKGAAFAADPISGLDWAMNVVSLPNPSLNRIAEMEWQTERMWKYLTGELS
jgi:hypothetical protein